MRITIHTEEEIARLEQIIKELQQEKRDSERKHEE